MSENPIEGNSVPGTASAKTQASEPQGQPLPENLEAVVANEVSRRLREFQGIVDKGIPKQVESAVDRSMDARFAEFAKRLGVNDPDKIAHVQRDMILDEIVDERLKPAIALGKAKAVSAFEVSELVAKVGLDASQPDVSALLMQKFENPADAAVAVTRLAVQKASQPNLTSAQSAAPTGGIVETKKDDTALAAELKTLYLEPTKNARRIKEIETLLGW